MQGKRSGFHALSGGALLVLLAGVALVGPHLVASPTAVDFERGLDALGAPRAPSAQAWLGTDDLGRDVLARLVAAAATSLWVAAVATASALGLGTLVGLVAGHAGGRLDAVLMRAVELTLAFPVLLLAILLATVLRDGAAAGSSAPTVLALALVSWTSIARLVRDRARVLARSEHVLAARSLGASAARIVTRHVLPNLGALVLATAAAVFAQCLVAESVLSFLGLGPPPPAPTWGRMLYEGRAYYRTAPHLVLAPGIAILVAVVAVHLCADALRARTERA